MTPGDAGVTPKVKKFKKFKFLSKHIFTLFRAHFSKFDAGVTPGDAGVTPKVKKLKKFKFLSKHIFTMFSVFSRCFTFFNI